MNITLAGRLNRQPYIIGYLIISFISAILTYLTKDSTSTLITIFVGIIGILMSITLLTLIVRRLHDLDKGGWFALILLIPFVSFLFSIYLWLAKGTDGPNRYGADPLWN